MKYWLTLLLLASITSTAWAEDVHSCKVIQSKNNYVLIEIDGKTYYALSPETFDQLHAATRQADNSLRELKERLTACRQRGAECEALVGKYEANRENYLSLTDKYNQTLSDSVTLTEKYQTESEKLVKLTGNYHDLARQYDALAGKYRDIAVDRYSIITLDLGIGATDNDGEAEFAGLVGIGVSWLKVWGFYQNNNSGLMVGSSLKF